MISKVPKTLISTHGRQNENATCGLEFFLLKITMKNPMDSPYNKYSGKWIITVGEICNVLIYRRIKLLKERSCFLRRER